MLEPVQFAPENGTVQPIAEADKIAAIVKAVVRAADAWGLSNAEAAALFDVPGATWSRMKAGTYKGVLDQDKVTRASLLIGLFKGRVQFNFVGDCGFRMLCCANGVPANDRGDRRAARRARQMQEM